MEKNRRFYFFEFKLKKKPVNEIVAEPKFAIQLTKSEFIVAPIDWEILPG